MAWYEGPLLGFDLETTGVDTNADLPVQVGLVWSKRRGMQRVETWLVDPGREIPDEAVAIHGITTEQARTEGCGLAETAERIHAALRRAAAHGIPVVAMNAGFDVTIAEGLFRAFGLPALAWRSLVDPLVLDRHLDSLRQGTRALDALCDHYRVRLRNAHDAGADAQAAVCLVRAIGRRYEECGSLTPDVLTLMQVRWHEEWACGQDAWRRAEGLDGLDRAEFHWPCRRLEPVVRAALSPELELARRRHPTLACRRVAGRSVA